MFPGGGSGPIRHSTNLGGVHLEVVLCDDESQEVNRVDMELTLLSLDEKLVIQEPLQDSMNMLYMSLRVRGKNQDVIQINKNKVI